MQYTRIGDTGMTVSRLCLGCMTYGGGELPSWTMQRDWALGMDAAKIFITAEVHAAKAVIEFGIPVSH